MVFGGSDSVPHEDHVSGEFAARREAERNEFAVGLERDIFAGILETGEWLTGPRRPDHRDRKCLSKSFPLGGFKPKDLNLATI